MRVLLSGGGTGGHVYPALAVIDALTSRPPYDRAQNGASGTAGVETQQGTSSTRLDPSSIGPSTGPGRHAEFLWVGSHAGVEADVVPRAGIPYAAIDVAGLRGMAALQLARNVVLLLRGTQQAYRIIGRFQPDVIFVTGGYVSAPVVLAGRVRRVPIVIYLPDIVPGMAIRSLAQLATRVAVSFEESRQYLPREKVVVTGYPVRGELFSADRDSARQNLGLDPAVSTLLVFGGSRGARRINRAVVAALDELLSVCQVIHVSGRLDIAEMQQRREALPAALKDRYHLFAYLHEEMIDALAVADLVVSRAGAATLGEFPAAGLPAIVVPYPHAGAHQAENAAVLAEAGGAIIVPDDELTGDRLAETVRQALADEERLALMRIRMSRLARPDAAWRIAEMLREEVSGGAG
ncbi:MAG: undecaprenyldiphospho-muramoylpentapeptide beta-N-acetylglucosaminyltransferase [Anaerolineae bacterium]